jgi:hypothetical protein
MTSIKKKGAPYITELLSIVKTAQLYPDSRSDAEKVKAAQEACQELLDWFYEAYQDRMAPQQYKAAKGDPDYFSVLIQLAYYDQEQQKC